ncbi:VOC family protein [Bacillus sp. FJAT-47783]|uniref:VOC family protein n=1 Tax=Bacillus sp. FJAT-47783 TaxID=2922712 RepID=UPI001FADF212|nr:VOC family protein [Bacillus sp. FJAT-47783]
MLTNKIYETHVYTRDLNTAIEFYQKMGLTLAHTVEERKVSFFWMGDPDKKEQMLGVWEVPADQWRSSHFAFHISIENMKKAMGWLKERGIPPREAFGKKAIEPIVHAWVPAASVYFRDLDGNSLEFLTTLPQEPKQELDMMYLSEWEKLHQSI